jgi:hypothetical protein
MEPSATGVERLMGMSDATWRRHANPWSVWTRMGILPLLALAIWSRVWIGLWAWVPVGLVGLWTWWNPRAFGEPESLDSWASKAVLGERVWLARGEVPLPERHRRLPFVLAGVAGLGVPFLAWGLWKLDLATLAIGMLLVYAGKLWFLDRMVWLWEDCRGTAIAERFR